MDRNKKIIIFISLIILFTIFIPSILFSHGDHGDAEQPEGGLPIVTVEGFQVELLTKPVPPRAGIENKIIAKVFKDKTLEPARNGKVFISIFPLKIDPSVKDMQGQAHYLQQDPQVIKLNLIPAPEIVWAGSYTAMYKPEKKGLHMVRIMIEEMEGRRFNPPLVLDFHLKFSGQKNYKLIFLLISTLIIGIIGIYAIAIRSKYKPKEAPYLNLLDIPSVLRLFRWKYFQISTQLPFLIIFIIVTILGFVDTQVSGKSLTTKLTWTIWWAGIIFTFLFVGRLWCLVCPFGVLNEFPTKIFKPERKFPRPLRNIWLATFMFLGLTWADEQLGIVRSPLITSWIIIFFAVLALIIGIFFIRRSFCRYLCPIGGLIGIYSMFSPVELRAKDKEHCKTHLKKDCYTGNEYGNGCPMFEFPQTIGRNNYCNFCGECIKTCRENNIVLRFRKFGKDLWDTDYRSLDESYLATALVGITIFVTAIMLSIWLGWLISLGKLIPYNFISIMKPVTFLSLLESIIFFSGSLLLIPVLVYLASYIFKRISGNGNNIKIRDIFIIFGYMFIPIGLSMHLSHNISHLLIEGSGIIPVIQRTFLEFTPVNLGSPDWEITPIVPVSVVYWIQMILLIVFLCYSIYTGFKLSCKYSKDKNKSSIAIIPLIILAIAFTLLNIYLLNQPMAARHIF